MKDWQVTLTLATFAVTAAAGALAQNTSSKAARQTGDPAAGERIFAQCRACHKADASSTSGLGPNLYRIVGRRSGTYTGFRYSPAMVSANRIWTEAALDAFLLAPAKSIPGTKMAYGGLKKPEDRKNVIVYLKSRSR